jgi:chromosome segregation ATPase
MEIDQMLKQIDWLDDEHRKTKTAIDLQEKRLTTLEGALPPLNQQIKDVNGDVTRLAAILGRIDQFDEALLQLRIEVKQTVETLEKQIRKREEDTEKVRRVELHTYDESLEEIRKEISIIAELKRGLSARTEEEGRLARLIDEVRLRIETLRRSEEEYTHSYRLLEDGRRQDAKRLTDLQGEAAALRKHVDDLRGKMELTSTTLRKIDSRLNEMSTLEVERREAQAKFLENQALLQVERERVWKDWQTRFDSIEQENVQVQTSLQELDTTHREVKRSQQTLEELNQIVERRINEMTEIQRLSEERFRQEWVTFKADDQKRWTNYTLTQEEQRGEVSRQYAKLTERVTQIEDSVQEIQDVIQQANEQTEKRLQSLLAVVHEWVSVYERTLGRTR